MSRAPLMMDAGHFAMAPLSDFVVTETKYGKKNLPQVGWNEWRLAQIAKHGIRATFDYEGLVAGGKVIIRMHANRPTDVEVILSENDAVYYKLLWADDPDPA